MRLLFLLLAVTPFVTAYRLSCGIKDFLLLDDPFEYWRKYPDLAMTSHEVALRKDNGDCLIVDSYRGYSVIKKGDTSESLFDIDFDHKDENALELARKIVAETNTFEDIKGSIKAQLRNLSFKDSLDQFYNIQDELNCLLSIKTKILDIVQETI